jgi:hypothetical protein
MKVLKAHDKFGWITAVINGRWVQAKVYDEPSVFGINDGRVSKLAIGKSSMLYPTTPFFDQMAYNYDRGLDFDDLPAGVLDGIVEELERLPKQFR